MSISSLQSTSVLSVAFFSKLNIESIQKQIRYQIYIKSGEEKTVISDQSPDQLSIVMRSIYLQHALNLPTGIAKQVITLNNMVIDFCVSQIWVEITQYKGYLRDIDQGMRPMDREMNLSKDSQLLVNNKIGFYDDDIPIGSLL